VAVLNESGTRASRSTAKREDGVARRMTPSEIGLFYARHAVAVEIKRSFAAP